MCQILNITHIQVIMNINIETGFSFCGLHFQNWKKRITFENSTEIGLILIDKFNDSKTLA